ncbi:MAG: terminase, partial [Paraburkholderia fungorum]|nr:terminase [Paraburkholderia fungorum]
MLETAEITPVLESNADPRRIARALYWQGWRVTSIARHLEIKRATVEAWKQRDEWDKATPIERIESSLETRLAVLIAKPEKDGRDFKEVDLLMRQVERMARVHKYGETGRESDLNPNIEARNTAPRKAKAGRNE